MTARSALKRRGSEAAEKLHFKMGSGRARFQPCPKGLIFIAAFSRLRGTAFLIEALRRPTLL